MLTYIAAIADEDQLDALCFWSQALDCHLDDFYRYPHEYPEKSIDQYHADVATSEALSDALNYRFAHAGSPWVEYSSIEDSTYPVDPDDGGPAPDTYATSIARDIQLDILAAFGLAEDASPYEKLRAQMDRTPALEAFRNVYDPIPF